MLKLIGGLAAIYGLAWICSTPESRAAAKPWANRVGRQLLALVLTVAGGVWLLSSIAGPPG